MADGFLQSPFQLKGCIDWQTHQSQLLKKKKVLVYVVQKSMALILQLGALWPPPKTPILKHWPWRILSWIDNLTRHLWEWTVFWGIRWSKKLPCYPKTLLCLLVLKSLWPKKSKIIHLIFRDEVGETQTLLFASHQIISVPDSLNNLSSTKV